MLLEDCTKLTGLSKEVTTLRMYAKDLKDFRTRQEQIRQALNEIKPLVFALRAFRERGIVDIETDQKTSQLLTEVAAIAAGFQADRGWLIGQQFNLRSFQAKVKSLKDDLNEQLKRAWTAYCAQHLRGTNEELLGILVKIDTFRDAVQRIQTLTKQLRGIEFPRDNEHFSQIDVKIAQLSQAWNSLRSDEVPEDVVQFLKAAAIGGASIDRLTPEVMSWLVDREIVNSFCVRLTQ